MNIRHAAGAALVSLAVLQPLHAQEAAAPAPAETPDGLVLLFGSGSAQVTADQQKQLDQASRLYRDGNPTVMIITGNADTVGDPANNLDLSIRRARAVADGLVARGIPVGRLQVLGQGNSDLPIVTEDEVPNADNRSVRITWR